MTPEQVAHRVTTQLAGCLAAFRPDLAAEIDVNDTVTNVVFWVAERVGFRKIEDDELAAKTVDELCHHIRATHDPAGRARMDTNP